MNAKALSFMYVVNKTIQGNDSSSNARASNLETFDYQPCAPTYILLVSLVYYSFLFSFLVSHSFLVTLVSYSFLVSLVFNSFLISLVSYSFLVSHVCIFLVSLVSYSFQVSLPIYSFILPFTYVVSYSLLVCL